MIVFDQTIVNKSDSFLMIIVWMCVDISLVTMSGPSGMTKPYVVLMSSAAFKLHALYAVTSEPVT